ncbi:MAG: DUF362 domain-containing protein [Marinilabiliaceae bacterium]|nr:DUF362 domain-containing protein [Marinilabiliaceae bacterium]
MAVVYYTPIDSKTSINDIQKISYQLLNKIIEKEEIELETYIPLKVHFGEKGNYTYIKPEYYMGIINFLKDRNIKSSYIETSVLYGGNRNKSDLHLQTALDHGFNQLPIIFADGEQGEKYAEIEINKKHFKSCKIGYEFLKYNQLIVISHFKGHTFAGFGGAIKQLSMGHASKGGKLAMHMGIKPKIINRKCKQCKKCLLQCNENAITIGKKSFIDLNKCVGCGACVSSCPHKAITITTVKGVLNAIFQGKNFGEKIVEYAFAAQLHKRNIYINYAVNITKGCDCEPRKMKPVISDFGILISTDPVAIDKACYDLSKEKGKTFKGLHQLDYAEKIGLGSQKYNLIEILNNNVD